MIADTQSDRLPNRRSAPVVLAVACFTGLTIELLMRWINAWLGWHLPSIGDIGSTLLFAGFSIAHSSVALGKRRTAVFFAISAVVSWAFEEVGVLTGLVYGKYRYSALLGPKLGEVPIIIPLAWFMMTYSSWMVAKVLLSDSSRSGRPVALPAFAFIAAMVMTSWDVVMDPGMSRAGNWTWEAGGSYLGVPVHNFIGWVVTMLVVYLAAGLAMKRVTGPVPAPIPRWFLALPVGTYWLVAIDMFVVQSVPQLRIVDVFTMILISVLASMRLAQSNGSTLTSQE